MDDKTLLELAAKAAGIDGRFIEQDAEDGYPTYSCGIGKIGAITTMWNPLEDDGDALRLAVKLSMKVYVGEAYPWHDDAADYCNGICVDQDECDDPYAATRRAIVRAAAAIGESL